MKAFLFLEEKQGFTWQTDASSYLGVCGGGRSKGLELVNELFSFEEKDKHGISAEQLTGLAVVLKYCR